MEWSEWKQRKPISVIGERKTMMEVPKPLDDMAQGENSQCVCVKVRWRQNYSTTIQCFIPPVIELAWDIDGVMRFLPENFLICFVQLFFIQNWFCFVCIFQTQQT